MLTEQAWTVKDFLYGFTEFLAGHGRQDRAIFPASVAIHRAGFGLSCPLTELAIHTCITRLLYAIY